MADGKRYVIGWLVDQGERAGLLARFEPRYAEVVAHHVTLEARVAVDTPPPRPVEGQIVGEADDGRGVQAMVVRIDGTTDRPDGSTYHITWSLAPGRRARESNDVIAERGWKPLPEPITVTLHPARIP